MSEIFETFFYQPILNLVIFLYNITPGHDLGVAIILLTIAIKAVLWPLSQQALKSQKNLQTLQPEIDKLKRKYKDKKEELSRAMLSLYQEKKINPFSSCLPLLIQLPFLFAVFKVFRDGFENGSLDLVYSFIARPETVNSISLGLVNLSEPNAAIAVLAGGAQYFQAKMTIGKQAEKKEGEAPNMAQAMNKQMLYVMPFLTVFIGMTLPGGLSLYWFATTVLTIAQQKLIFQKDDENGDGKIIEGKVVR